MRLRILLSCFLAVIALASTALASPCSDLPAAASAEAPRFGAEGAAPESFWLGRIGIGQQNLVKYRGSEITLGDSIANNYGNWLDAALPQYFGHRLANLAVGGDKVENVLWRLRKYDFSGYEPPAVIIIVGTNNLAAKEPEGEIVDQMMGLVCAVHARLPKTRIVLFSILPRGRFRTQFAPEIATMNASLDQLKTRFGYTFVNPNAWLMEQCGAEELCHLYKDYVHVLPEVYGHFTDMLKQQTEIAH